MSVLYSVYSKKLKKLLYGIIGEDDREIISMLWKYKGVEIIVGTVCEEHVYFSVAIVFKQSIASFIRYLKGKSTLMQNDKYPEL